MNSKKAKYTIPLQKTHVGVQECSFTIQRAFIEQNDIEDVYGADISVELRIETHNNMRTIELSIHGTIDVLCDRCREECSVEIEHSETFLVKTDELGHEFTDEENVILVSPQDVELDMTDLFREMIIVSIPLQKMHPENECNPEIERLLDSEKRKEHTESNKTDPRWDTLKKLFDN
ncbi:MAG: DUF177 domain-containing protein [Bacteroidales bacterium]